jgi:cytoskeletal protein CcmA (bactofilin family)
METASMFGRKKSETEDRKMSDAPDDLGIPTKPVRNNSGPIAPGQSAPGQSTPGQSTNVAPLGRAASSAPLPPSAVPARPAEPPRAAPEPLRPAGMLPTEALSPAAPRHDDADLRKLIVGREITLSGEINSCDKLIVEGSVEANLQNCTEVELAESGLFKGSATIDEIEVRGRFEGNLTVRKRLLIRATGIVSGTIRYGQIEIECGGQISGDVQANSGQASAGQGNAKQADAASEPLSLPETRAAF